MSAASKAPAVQAAADALRRQPGTARIDLMDTPHRTTVARRVTRHWCLDRALPEKVTDDIQSLVSEAVAIASLSQPRSISLLLGWRDADHACIEVSWRSDGGPPSHSRRLPGAAAEIFDALTDAWGFAAPSVGTSLCFVVDASAERAVGAATARG